MVRDSLSECGVTMVVDDCNLRLIVDTDTLEQSYRLSYLAVLKLNNLSNLCGVDARLFHDGIGRDGVQSKDVRAIGTGINLGAYCVEVHLVILLRRSLKVGKGRCLQVIDTLASIDTTIAWAMQDIIRGVFRNKSGGQTGSLGRLKEGTGTTDVSVLGNLRW